MTATFASGMNMTNVSITVIADKIVEEHEEFDLSLHVPSSLGPAITAGSRNRARGIITDSTGKCVTLQVGYKILKLIYLL